MRKILPIIFLAISISCAPKRAFYNPKQEGWESNTPPPESELVKTVFLLGDAGKPAVEPLEPTFQILDEQLKAEDIKGKEWSLIFLGDNIYPRGLPDIDYATRRLSEKYLKTQLDLVKDKKGKGFMIPGNHDWERMGKRGWRYVLNEEKFVTEYLGNPNVFFPKNGCPGPVEIELDDDLVLIIIDTQWWLHRWAKPGTEDGCDVSSKDDFIQQLDFAVQRNKHKKVIVAGHHPMFSNGTHGGHSRPINHLFPITDAKERLYIPLPVLGSIYVFYRTLVGDPQDIPFPTYQRLKSNLLRVFDKHPNLVYVAGHEHNLQYFDKKEAHFIVSGSGCKQTYTTHRKKASFAYGRKGFSRMNYYKNGDVWVEFWTPDGPDLSGKVVFRKKLFNHTYVEPVVVEDTTKLDCTGQTKDYKATEVLGMRKKGSMLGRNYRQEWREIMQDVPVFDIRKEKGGLVIVKKGGGMQTKSLRLQAEDGKQYVLRSVEKFPEKAVPENLRKTLAEDVVTDLVSASHPYGAFVLPKLADAAGIYHTNPKLVYLPDDPRLGEFREQFGDALYLFEERPDEDWRDADFFGNSKDIKSTRSAIEDIIEDNDDYIDEKMVVKSRLFDMWIGDWDRHDDQWRWAEFKDENGDKFFQPIPRDRDQTFFDSDGWLLKIGSKNWAMPKFQGFKNEIRDVTTLNFNARHFDRTFITESSKEVWLAMADSLKRNLTDEIIEDAIKDFPKEIYQYHGDEIISKLKKRRDDLSKYAEEYYFFLAKVVNVVGSDKHEFFKVERLDNDNTRVRVWKQKKDGERKQKIYDRTFKKKETKEIRLYGLDGRDDFEITGDVTTAIRLRIVGGDGKDEIVDNSNVGAFWKKTYVYDVPKTKIDHKGEVKDMRSNSPDVNLYDRKEFKYDVNSPVLSFAFNPDDGIFVGGGLQLTRNAFRKNPYSVRHTFKANIAPKTSSYNFFYKAEFRALINKWDFVFDADLRVPSFTNFYYGLGNGTDIDRGKGNDFYRSRYSQVYLHPQLRRQTDNEEQTLTIGGYFQNVEIEEPENGEERFISTNANSQPLIGVGQNFVGVTGAYIVDTRNNKHIPKSGFRMKLENSLVKGLSDDVNNINYYQFKGDVSVYKGFGRLKRIVLATRVGGAINSGEYEYFQANTLGGFENLRGYGRMRFAGDKALYQNTEIRIKLFHFRSPIFPGGFGIVGMNDFGRVWYNGENGVSSNEIHHGYGGGIWIAPFEKAAVVADYTTSEEGGRVFVRFGFLF